jgi:exodeoxyribonuclease VII large subunit
LQLQSPVLRLANTRAQLQRLQTRMQTLLLAQHERLRSRLTIATRTLDTLSPLATLTRGYAIVSDSQGDVVIDAGKLQSGDAVTARLAKGRVIATVNHVERDED